MGKIKVFHKSSPLVVVVSGISILKLGGIWYITVSFLVWLYKAKAFNFVLVFTICGVIPETH